MRRIWMENSQFHDVHETLIIIIFHQLQVQNSYHGVQKQKTRKPKIQWQSTLSE
jgi:hypothetical protein